MCTEALQYKNNFIKGCEKYRLPIHNKAAFLFAAAAQYKDNPADNQLYHLLVAAVCDCDLLFDRFFPQKSDYEWECEYETTLTRYRRFENALEHERQLAADWQEVLNRKTLPCKFETTDPEQAIDTETTFLVNAFRQIFYVSETNSRCLYDNISNLVRMTRSFPLLRRVAPLFFYQTMTQHTSRLAKNESFTAFSLSRLWKYKQYTIETNNDKNYTTYKRYSRLFRRLLKFYKADSAVDRNLCRYGFCSCSNLPEWIAFMQEKKYKKFLTPLMRFYAENPQTCLECYEQLSEFSPNAMFGIKEKKDTKYFTELLYSTLAQIEDTVNDFLDRHPDLMMACADNLYLDTAALIGCVNRIYHQAGVEPLFPAHIPLPYRLSNIYAIVIHTIDEAMNRRIKEALSLRCLPPSDSRKPT